MSENGNFEIKPEGLSPLGSASREKVVLDELRISSATSLQELSKEFHFFTVGLLYSVVPLAGRDPMADFLSANPAAAPSFLEFDKQLFSGFETLGDAGWNNRLQCLPIEQWDSFCAFMGSLVFLDRDSQTLFRLRTQDTFVTDPMERYWMLGSVPLSVPITAFVLDTNKGCWFLSRGPSNFYGPPQVKRVSTMVFPDTKHFADELLKSDNPDPYNINQSKD